MNILSLKMTQVFMTCSKINLIIILQSIYFIYLHLQTQLFCWDRVASWIDCNKLFSPSEIICPGCFPILAFLHCHLLHCMSFLPIMHPVHYRSSNMGNGHFQTRHHGHPVEQIDGGGRHVLQGKMETVILYLTIELSC